MNFQRFSTSSNFLIKLMFQNLIKVSFPLFPYDVQLNAPRSRLQSRRKTFWAEIKSDKVDETWAFFCSLWKKFSIPASRDVNFFLVVEEASHNKSCRDRERHFAQEERENAVTLIIKFVNATSLGLRGQRLSSRSQCLHYLKGFFSQG